MEPWGGRLGQGDVPEIGRIREQLAKLRSGDRLTIALARHRRLRASRL